MGSAGPLLPLPPHCQHAIGVLRGAVVHLTAITLPVIPFPLALWFDRYCLPPSHANRSAAFVLPIDGFTADRLTLECRNQASPLHRKNVVAMEFARVLRPRQFDHGGHQVDDMPGLTFESIVLL